MKRKFLPGLAVAAVLLLSFFLSGSVNARRNDLSSTRRVVIDGRAFVRDESAGGERSLLRKELGRLGARLPDGFDLPEAPVPTHPAFSGRLERSTGGGSIEAPRLPAGLTAEHTLRMEGEGKPVTLVLGRMGTRGPSIRARLLSTGWKSVSTAEDPGTARVLRNPHGKETTLVCLDEAEGSFLLFREVGR
jgi:hypothetical protein